VYSNVHVFTCIQMFMYLRVFKCSCIHVYSNVHVFTCIQMFMYSRVFKCSCIHVYSNVHVFTCIQMFMYSRVFKFPGIYSFCKAPFNINHRAIIQDAMCVKDLENEDNTTQLHHHLNNVKYK